MSTKTTVVTILVGAASAGAGFFAGRYLTTRKLDRIHEQEVADIKAAYAPFQKEGLFATPGAAASALIPSGDDSSDGIDEESSPESRSEAITALNDDIRTTGRAHLNGVLSEHGTDESDESNHGSDLPLDEGIETTGGTVSEDESGAVVIDGDDMTIQKSIWDKTRADPAQRIPYNKPSLASLVADGYYTDGPQPTLPTEEEMLQDLPDDEPQESTDDFVIQRNPDKPYIIDYNTFMLDDVHSDSKLSLTYFEAEDSPDEDGTLIDERDTVVRNVEEAVGEDSLNHFGLGSGDKNIVYIRNEKLGADYEIIRDKRGYNEVVLNIKPAKSGPLRFRDDD